MGDNAWNFKLDNLVATITFLFNLVTIPMSTFVFPLNPKPNPWMIEIIF